MSDIKPLDVRGNRYCDEDGCRLYAMWSVIITPTHIRLVCNRHRSFYTSPPTRDRYTGTTSEPSQM